MNVYASELGCKHCFLSGPSTLGPHPPFEARKDPRLAGLARLAGQTAPGTPCLYYSSVGITSVFPMLGSGDGQQALYQLSHLPNPKVISRLYTFRYR